MKLYYSPGACSMAVHITALELDLKLELVRVNLREHQTELGEDYYQINPKGYVPFLVLDNGETLSEGVAILNYLADNFGNSKLTVKKEDFTWYKFLEWFTFANSEIHKMLGALFAPNLEEDRKQIIIERVLKRIAILDDHFKDHKFVLGSNITVVDIYIYVCMQWAKFFDLDLSSFTNYLRFEADMHSRTSVQNALKAEGLN